MREWLREHHVWMRLLSVLIAIILWAVIIWSENPERSLEFTGINVEFIGQNTLLRDSNLVLVEGNAVSVALKVKGTFSALKNVTTENLIIRVDVSGCSEVGHYELNYQVSRPDGITVTDRSLETIPVDLEEIVEKELEVRFEYTGNLAEDLETGEPVIKPSTVRVSGASSVMEKAAYAIVKINAAELTDNFSGNAEYIIVDEKGNELISTNNKYIDKTVNIEIPVLMTKTVPVEVNVLGTSGVPKTNIIVVCEPSTVTITGSVSDIQKIKSIPVVGDINTRSFVLSYEGELKLNLPENVFFKDEVVNKVAVSISFRDIEKKEITIDKSSISIINPHDANVILDQDNLIITVRGKKDILKSLDVSAFKVTVDLGSIPPLPDGIHLVEATVKCSTGGIDICGNYKVFINVINLREGDDMT